MNDDDLTIIAPTGPNTEASSSTTCPPETSETEPAALDRRDLAAEDAGRQAPFGRDEDGRPPAADHRHPARSPPVLRGPRQPRRGQEASGRTVRRHPPQTAADGGHHRPSTSPASHPPKELITRLLTGRCEMCGDAGTSEVHQIRKLTDLATPGSHSPQMGRRSWRGDDARPASSARACHDTIHSGNLPRHSRNSHRESHVRGKRARRFGGGPLEKDLPRRHLASAPPHFAAQGQSALLCIVAGWSSSDRYD